MAKKLETGSFAAKVGSAGVTDDRLLNQRTVELIDILNDDMPAGGVNHYEMLRRNLQDNPALKSAYSGVVKTGEVITAAVKLYAEMLSLGEKTGGMPSYDEVVKQGSAQRIYDDIVNNVLPTVIEQRTQRAQGGVVR
jgi:hypothetical protein